MKLSYEDNLAMFYEYAGELMTKYERKELDDVQTAHFTLKLEEWRQMLDRLQKEANR